MSNKIEPVAIGTSLCEVIKVQSLKDGGARITLEVGYNNMEIIQALMVKAMSPNSLVVCGWVEPSEI